MLVQSTTRDLYLLPALPRDKWANGCVKGLKARGGQTVNICWKEGDLHEVGLWSEGQNSVKRIHYRGTTVMANLSSNRVYTFNGNLKCVNSKKLWEVASFFSCMNQIYPWGTLFLYPLNNPRNWILPLLPVIPHQFSFFSQFFSCERETLSMQHLYIV